MTQEIFLKKLTELIDQFEVEHPLNNACGVTVEFFDEDENLCHIWNGQEFHTCHKEN